MNQIILLFLEKVCEAIYFSLFLIYGKNLKEKRLLFTIIMIAEYLMITKLIEYNIWIHILYITMTYINLKVLYREKAQITDIFLFASASIVLILISILCSSILIITNIYWLYYPVLIINRILMFLFLLIFKNNINKWYKIFCNNWNKKVDNKIKSLTLRNISVIIFNLMFYVINIYMLYAILTRK